MTLPGNPYAMQDALKDQADREGVAYVDWCERNDLDPSDDHWGDFTDAMDQAREDAAIAKGEARMEEARLGWE